LSSSNTFSTCPHNMATFSPLMAEISSLVWSTPANFNGFHILASLLHRCRSLQANQTMHDVVLNLCILSGLTKTFHIILNIILISLPQMFRLSNSVMCHLWIQLVQTISVLISRLTCFFVFFYRVPSQSLSPPDYHQDLYRLQL